jgi:hypothetical protein
MAADQAPGKVDRVAPARQKMARGGQREPRWCHEGDGSQDNTVVECMLWAQLQGSLVYREQCSGWHLTQSCEQAGRETAGDIITVLRVCECAWMACAGRPCCSRRNGQRGCVVRCGGIETMAAVNLQRQKSEFVAVGGEKLGVLGWHYGAHGQYATPTQSGGPVATGYSQPS